MQHDFSPDNILRGVLGISVCVKVREATDITFRSAGLTVQ